MYQTLKQRFVGTENCAPNSFGCPSVTQNVDYSVFKKSKEEKIDVVNAKLIHKNFMKKHGVDYKKYLNIPELRLESPIVITT